MTPRRERLSNKQREALYERCRGEKEFPDCNICFLPIQPGQQWHASHNPHLPRALGGLIDGIAHDRCNLQHAHTHDVPLIAKIRRRHQKHTGAFRTSRPLPGGRSDTLKKKLTGEVVKRHG